MNASDSVPIPYHAYKAPPSGRVLVLAPHPDDEVFGCGGAILRHVAQGDAVRVIILTEGGLEAEGRATRQAYVATRQAESRLAAEVLGYGEPVFWDYPDGNLAYGEALIQRLLAAMQDWQAEHVYLTAPTEIHPDHQALCAAGTEAARCYGKLKSLRMYEVGQALHPNFFLDITDLQAPLIQAAEAFASQLQKHRYRDFMQGRWAFRTYTLPREVTAAEAYYCLSGEALTKAADLSALALPEGMRPDTLRAHDRPLISVIVRSIGDPHLPQTLASIAAQTYPRVEVILVDARAGAPLDIGVWGDRFPLRTVAAGQPLPRAEAANVGLEEVQGEFFAYLDDDDYWYPHHLHALQQSLAESEAVAAYAPMRWERPDGESGILDQPFYLPQALIENTIPNHAILYRREVKEAACRFDPQLEVYEDWDFVLQAATLGSFSQVAEPGGLYRMANRSGVHHPNLSREACYRKVQEKWRKRITEPELFYQQLLPGLRQWQTDHQARLQTLTEANARLEGKLKHMTQSRSWRLTAWLRKGYDRLTRSKHD